MEYNDLINELLDLLDKFDDIKRIKTLKKNLIANQELKDDINYFRLTKTIYSKEKILENKNYLKYLESENNINYLVYEIKKKFNSLIDRKGCHESH